jgi:glycosyltransferase involved in cell wall biosynthesis
MAVLEPGGAQLGILRLTRELERLGVRSRILVGDATPAGVELFARAGVEVEAWRIRAQPVLQYACSRAWAEWLRSRLAGAEIVHAHMFGGWWAAATAAPPGVPLVASEHNALRWPRDSPTGAMRSALRRVDLFFAHAPSNRRDAITAGLPAARVRRGRSPVAGLHVSPEAALDPRRVVFVGRLHPEKGPDLLIEALARLDAPPPALIVGSGPLESSLRALARSGHGASAVTFCGWHDHPAQLLAGAAACVVPSRDEAWSQAAVLAMSLRVPVLGTDVEGLDETLAGGRGVLAAPDPAALSQALADLLAGRRVPDLDRAQRYARRFRPARVARLYADAYARLAAEAVLSAA